MHRPSIRAFLLITSTKINQGVNMGVALSSNRNHGSIFQKGGEHDAEAPLVARFLAGAQAESARTGRTCGDELLGSPSLPACL